MKSQCANVLLCSIVVFCIVVCLTGCMTMQSPHSTETTQPPTPPSELLPTSNPAPTLSGNRPTPGAILRTDTPIPSVVVVPTYTPFPSPNPTLAASEALAFIRQMQVNNGGCKLPCWWGITPGETTWEEAKQVFAPLRGYSGVRSPVGFSFPQYSGIDASVYGESGEPVREIWVFGSVYGTERKEQYLPFDETWYLYSSSGILEQLGPPSKAMLGFNTGSADSSKWYYELHVFYDESGLIIRYGGLAIADSKSVRACLSLDHLTSIRIYVRVPRPDGFQGPPWDYSNAPQPLELATGLSLEEFCANSRHDNACLESPIDLWPP